MKCVVGLGNKIPGTNHCFESIESFSDSVHCSLETHPKHITRVLLKVQYIKCNYQAS